MSASDDIQDEYLDIPLDQGVVLERDEWGTPQTNVPHLVMHHSADGYEWSYVGGGPNDLALNIVENYLRRQDYSGKTITLNGNQRVFRLSWILHYTFTFKFLAHMSYEGGRIYADTINLWLTKKIAEEAIAQRNAGV